MTGGATIAHRRWGVRAALALASLVGAFGLASTAHAEVKRWALLVGADQGFAHETKLAYAEADVDAVADTLTAVGGVASERIVRLKAPTPERLRNTLVDLNLTIQREVRAGVDAVLLVFYSGHGDGETLHLGHATLATDELSKLVRLSPARLKVLVVDACRSGMLTRVKGGRQVAPFRIEVADELRNEGYAIITSSAAGEDAQESEELRSSIFTHHFLAGLRGLGDSNRDGLVTLGETYAYAYEQALKTSSTSMAGSQHATFDYDLRGRADPVLADLRSGDGLAALRLATAGEYLVMHAESNALLWEAVAPRGGASLLLPPGRYHVRLRTNGGVYETDVALVAGDTRPVDSAAMRAVPLAQVVRKGDGARALAMGPSVHGTMHGPLAAGFSPALGGEASFAWDLPHISWAARLGVGRSSASALASNLRSHDLTELSLEVLALYAFDVADWIAVGPLMAVGGAQLWQRIEQAPGCLEACVATRTPRAFLLSAGVWAALSLSRRLALEGRLEAANYTFNRQADTATSGALAPTWRAGTLTWRAGIGLGFRY